MHFPSLLFAVHTHTHKKAIKLFPLVSKITGNTEWVIK